MSQTSLDSNTAPEGSPSDQTSSKQSAARRRRRPASRASQAVPAAVAQPAAQLDVPAHPDQAAPSSDQQATPALAPEPTPTITSAPAPAAEAARGRPAPRPRRRTSSRKSDVQLVIPPAAPAEQTPPADEAEPRVVPVMTEQDVATAASLAEHPAEPLSLEPAAPAEATLPSPEAQPPMPSRYRFGRRTAAPAPAGAVRTERLSGPLSTPTVPAESAESTDVAPEVGMPMPMPMPMPVSTSAAPTDTAEQAERPTRDMLDDIVSALGLRGTDQAELTELAEPAEADEAAHAETESETEAEAGATDEAETQAGPRRRRRRRRSGASHGGAAEDEAAEAAEQPELPEGVAAMPFDEPEAERGETNGYEPYGGGYAYAEQAPYSPYSRPVRERDQAPRQPWDVAAGTQQVRQPESPFGAPEPSFARGFGPQPRGVAGPAREAYPRTGRPDQPPMSPNVLASTVTHAIQQQTDRLLSELRHQANPPAMTVMFPPFPSTERVGVFVDVANLLYSARSLRISIDFGRLLDFLRGNRRLTRAHAYAPTNPDPHAEQAFLSAVKGLGYRITTKNYKTFSSGAKKADMDLDLCMDIVRLVDAKALDSVVLVSGDSDFLPLLEYCSDHGVRVEVAAFDDSAAMILRQSCDLFINLSLVDDIRA